MISFHSDSTFFAPLAALDSLPGYSHYFKDASLWEPYVRLVAAQELDCQPIFIRSGKAGTFPTFIVDERWVIKFFGSLFDGAEAFSVEVAAAHILQADPTFPSPRLVGEGILTEQPSPWRFLIFEFLPGIPFGDVYDRVSPVEREKVAELMGIFIRRLHQLPLNVESALPPERCNFSQYISQRLDICLQEQRRWNTLPGHLLAQVEDYLLPLDELVDGESLHFIHADLTGDHLLGWLQNGSWRATGLIDYGDAMVGNLYYELPALYLDLFHCDSRLLQVFFRTYGYDQPLDSRFKRILMSYLLLFPFNILSFFRDQLLPLNGIATLDEMATLILGL